MNPATDVPQLSTAALAALHRGSKIDAIKAMRAEYDLGLKEAKDLVEAQLGAQPALKATFDAAQAQGSGAALRWLAVLAAGAVVAYYVYTQT